MSTEHHTPEDLHRFLDGDLSHDELDAFVGRLDRETGLQSHRREELFLTELLSSKGQAASRPPRSWTWTSRWMPRGAAAAVVVIA
jgi:hypothetical protein